MPTSPEDREMRPLPLDAVVLHGNLDSAKASHLLLGQSHGWLGAAEAIVMRAVAQGGGGGVYHVLPAVFALYHGVELFLKGVTWELRQTYNARTHDLDALLRDYNECLENCGRQGLAIKANIQRLIEWDRRCRRSGQGGRLPHGTDLRFILDTENKPSWPGVSLRFQDVVDWSREYRRDFARIRRLLLDVKGIGHFWEEGTFSREYPDQPLWFFCLRAKRFSKEKDAARRVVHELRDSRGREWTAYEGEAIHEDNFMLVSVGRLPRLAAPIECSLNELPRRLAELD